MTRDEILALKPGRELDALVAEKVMGWRKKTFPGGGGGYTAWVDENKKAMKLISNFTMIETCYRCDYFRPSTDIAAAWEVVEKMLERGGCEIGCYGSKSGGKWFEVNVITMNGEVKVTAHTAPEAICKAALLAVINHD